MFTLSYWQIRLPRKRSFSNSLVAYLPMCSLEEGLERCLCSGAPCGLKTGEGAEPARIGLMKGTLIEGLSKTSKHQNYVWIDSLNWNNGSAFDSLNDSIGQPFRITCRFGSYVKHFRNKRIDPRTRTKRAYDLGICTQSNSSDDSPALWIKKI